MLFRRVSFVRLASKLGTLKGTEIWLGEAWWWCIVVVECRQMALSTCCCCRSAHVVSVQRTRAVPPAAAAAPVAPRISTRVSTAKQLCVARLCSSAGDLLSHSIITPETLCEVGQRNLRCHSSTVCSSASILHLTSQSDMCRVCVTMCVVHVVEWCGDVDTAGMVKTRLQYSGP